MLIAGPSFSIEESNKLRAKAIMELAAARPELEPAPYDSGDWISGILVRVERPEQVLGVPPTVRGKSIYVFVRSLNRIVTPKERTDEDRKWLLDGLARLRGRPLTAEERGEY